MTIRRTARSWETAPVGADTGLAKPAGYDSRTVIRARGSVHGAGRTFESG